MKHQEAVGLIRDAVGEREKAQLWADLGCGTGTFTMALASLLSAGTIHAVDRNKTAISSIPALFKEVVICKYTKDFTRFRAPQQLDGILMANALHYVKEKETFLNQMADCLKPGGCFLIVEYDSDVANPWVPYPVSFYQLQTLFEALRFSPVTKMAEMPSLYNAGNIYSALVSRSAVSR